MCRNHGKEWSKMLSEAQVNTLEVGSEKKKKPLTNKLKDYFKNLFSEIWEFRISYLFIAPFMIMFLIFIIIPVVTAIGLSFTYFNSIQFPEWSGWLNYQTLFSQDIVFLQNVLPNTFKFSFFVGPVVFILAFFLSWFISQLPNALRMFFALGACSLSVVALGTFSVFLL